MVWLLAPAAVALGLALVLGGSARAPSLSGVKAWPLVVLAFAIELILYNPPLNAQPWAMRIGPWIWLTTQLVFFGVLAANAWSGPVRTAWPWSIAAFGVGLNCLVIALNGGHMPTVWDASHLDASRLQNVVALTADSRLPWLADVIVEPGWMPRSNVVSVGDLLLSLGVATWIFTAAHTPGQFVRVTMGARNGTRIDGAARPHQAPAP